MSGTLVRHLGMGKVGGKKEGDLKRKTDAASARCAVTTYWGEERTGRTENSAAKRRKFLR